MLLMIRSGNQNLLICVKREFRPAPEGVKAPVPEGGLLKATVRTGKALKTIRWIEVHLIISACFQCFYFFAGFFFIQTFLNQNQLMTRWQATRKNSR